MGAAVCLLDLSKDELTGLLAVWGQPRFRADHVWGWIYQKLAADPLEMTNLPGPLRERLAAETRLQLLETVYEQMSRTGRRSNGSSGCLKA